MNQLIQVLRSRITKFILSLLLLVYLLRLVDLELFTSSLNNIDFKWLLLAILILPFSVFIRVYSFFMIINKDGFKMSVKDSLLLSLIGAGLNLFLPASSGDIVKIYFSKKHGLKEELLSTSIYDKLTSVITVFALGSFTAYFLKLFKLSLVAVSLTALFSIPLFAPKMVPWNLLNKALDLIRQKELLVDKLLAASTLKNYLKVRVLLWSLFGWIVTYFSFYVIAQALNAKVSFMYILAIAPLITVARLFPFTLSGLGSTEATVVYLFGLVGIQTTVALVISLFFQFIYVILPGLIGYFLILFQRSRTE